MNSLFKKKLIGIFCWLVPALAIGADVNVQGLRIWPSPGNVRVVLDLNKPVKYKIFTLNSPYRIVVDLDNVQFNVDIKTIALEKTNINNLRIGKPNAKISRVVFETAEDLIPKDFLLAPNEKYGHRLVIDLESKEKQAILALFDLGQMDEPKAKIITPKQQLPERDFIIAVDPGHGGEDPGAIGLRGTQEKEITLKISRELKDLINKQHGLRSFLIRDGDYYVDLRERMQRARVQNADLFISIHADAFISPRVCGSSAFILSKHGASSEAAKWLAEKENRSDLVGGVSLDNKSDVLASVLLDLSQAANEDASLEAANHILKALGKSLPLHKRHVERAGFAVLKSPDIPSILVEAGFISNPNTERFLRSDNYRRQIARNIVFGIQQYFAGKSKRMLKEPIKKSMQQPKFVYHIVQQGDTIGKFGHQ